MVRNYIKKLDKRKTYSNESLQQALSDIENGLSIRGASKNIWCPFQHFYTQKEG